MSLASIYSPGSAPPFDPAVVPDTVVLKAGHARLELTWSGGQTANISAERLRAHCRCAWCTRARIDDCFPASFDGIIIAALNPIGDYAINIAFSDGHARGVYPWTYLHALAREAEGMTAAAPISSESLQDGSPV
jgi:prepilin-type processing-associated H-X9-DG protein